jgi:hypothetical protein
MQQYERGQSYRTTDDNVRPSSSGWDIKLLKWNWPFFEQRVVQRHE